jgi:phenylacetate-CoA ligase
MDMIYDTKGRIVFPHLFYKISDFSEHKQFQFIQEDKNIYTFKLNSNEEKTNQNGMSTYFKKYLGNDAVFNFIYVNEIPLLASGKRKKVVNNYIK